MILTLTPNPSVDRTATLGTTLTRGAVHRLESVTTESGGKGVNISRAAKLAGIPTVALVPVDPHDPYVSELRDLGIDVDAVTPAGPVRVNLTVTEPDGTTTKLNSPGTPVTAAHLERLAAAALTRAGAGGPGDWIVLAGSVPPGTPDSWYAGLVQSLRGTGVRVAVDTSDAPLRALVEALPAAAPDLLKPNGEELASLTGTRPDTLESDPNAARAAAQSLVDGGVAEVLVTLGAAGALLVTAHGSWFAAAPRVEVVSTVGAGDSSLFGLLLGHERTLPPPERLALAVAYGSAAAGLRGTSLPAPHDVHPDRVSVTALDPADAASSSPH